MIVDAAYESFDRDKFTRYLIEHKVAPRLIKSAESVALEKKVKAPHLRMIVLILATMYFVVWSIMSA